MQKINLHKKNKNILQKKIFRKCRKKYSANCKKNILQKKYSAGKIKFDKCNRIIYLLEGPHLSTRAELRKK